ncbi:hypothetical protein ACGFW5_31295 [Streptomyces sp. NPDC048416]|uniref:hypothetical protein n=1 Tax=Streptomyces sp. NPDC048416 TaxID=3365546 RepID=UPI003721CBAF
MQPLHFEPVRAHGLMAHHHLPGDRTVVTRHWPGLFRTWPEGEGPTPFSEYAVNNNNAEEVAVYAGLVWRLTEGLTRYAIPAYCRYDAERLLAQEPVLVDWEYEVDAEQLTATSRDKGFVPGRSARRLGPGPRDGGAAHDPHAGLFRLVTPRDLVGLLHAVLVDASAEITVFAVEPGQDRHTDLVGALRGAKRPDLADVIAGRELFVDLTIGSDVGNHDSIMVASHADVGPRLAGLASDYRRRVTAYEDRADSLSDTAAFLRAMPSLTGVGLDAR